MEKEKGMLGNLWFEDYVKIGDDIWFAAGSCNSVYKFNINSKKVKWIADFPGEPVSKEWAFRRVRLWEGKLIFMPVYANSVYAFDLKSESFERFDVLEEKEASEYQTTCKFQCYEIYGEWLYIVGYEYPGIIKVNLRDRRVQKLANIPEVACTKSLEVQGYFGSDNAVKENFLYITCPSSNKILILDMQTDCFEVITIGSEKNRYNGICEIEGIYYLRVYDNDNLVQWDQRNGSCREIELKFGVHFFDRKICKTQNYIWVFSYFTNEVFRIDNKGRGISKILLNHSENRMWLAFCKEMPEGIYFVNLNSGEWHFLKENGIDVDLHFIMKDPDSMGIMKRLLLDDQIREWSVLRESYIVPLQLLFLKVFEIDQNKEKVSRYDSCGKYIYEKAGGKI